MKIFLLRLSLFLYVLIWVATISYALTLPDDYHSASGPASPAMAIQAVLFFVAWPILNAHALGKEEQKNVSPINLPRP